MSLPYVQHSAIPTIPGLSVYSNIGALLLGNVAVGVLFGITSVQAYLYVSNNNDGKLLRSLILLLWFLDIWHLAFVTIFVYHFAVVHFGDVTSLLIPTWSGSAHIVTTTFSDIIVRSIFIFRVSSFVRSKLLASVLGFLALVTFSGGMTVAILSARAADIFELNKKLWIMDMAYGSAVAADIILTTALCWSLAQYRRVSPDRTARVIRVLMLYTVNSGALVAAFTVTELIVYAVMPHNNIYQAIYFQLPTLFVNALLATLNARQSIREHSTGNIVTIPLSRISDQSDGVRGPRPSDSCDERSYPGNQTLQVKVDTTYEVHSECA